MVASFCLNFSLFIYFLFTERKTKLILSASLSFSLFSFPSCRPSWGRASCRSLVSSFFVFVLPYSRRSLCRRCRRRRLRTLCVLLISCVYSICLSQFLGMFDGSLSFSGRSLSLTTHSFIKKFCLPKTFFFVSICFKSDSILVYFNLPLFVHLLFRLIFFPFLVGLRHSFMPFKCL